MKMKLTRSSGNVFTDLGFPPEEAEHLKIRSDLMIELCKAIKARGLKQADAAKMLGVTPNPASAISSRARSIFLV